MKIKYLALIFYAIFVASCNNQKPTNCPSVERGFTSWMPAATADDALLSGNGEMGIMVFGRPQNDVIIINHAQSWLPSIVPPKPINQKSRLAEIKKLLYAGKFKEASQIPVNQSYAEGYERQIWHDPFVPVVDLNIGMKADNIQNYKRMVNFETGETIVYWEQNGQWFKRTAFVSRADSIIVINITSSGSINCDFEFSQHPADWNEYQAIRNKICNTQFPAHNNYIEYNSEFTIQWEGNVSGFKGVGRIINDGGNLKTEGKKLIVENANEVTAFVKIEPTIVGKPTELNLTKTIENISCNYSELIEHQKETHGKMFNRVSIEINNSATEKIPDSEPMRLSAKNRKPTDGTIVKEFDAARYNILCSAGINPPHLQGIWGNSWTPPWSSDFTHDGNVPTAISAMLSAHNEELLWSYFNYHKRMLPYYRENARNLFGCRGIIVPSHSSSHGYNVHFDPTWCLTFWTGGAGWAASFFYDYYLYTQNIDFLQNDAFPFMKEVALFYEDFLKETDQNGKFIFIPSYSPENNPKESSAQSCINATMDVMIARELLRNCIEAANILGETEKVEIWQQMLSKMPEYEINSDGALREWLWAGFSDNYEHRHISHLYALFDRLAPEFQTDSALRKAATEVIKRKIDFRKHDAGGEMAFGLAQLGMVACNLEDSATAAWAINMLAANYWTNSLASEHNPGSLFNMDISGGYPALIIKSLIYSEVGKITLLPAKPNNWKSGTLKGCLLRGGLVAEELRWTESQIFLKINSKSAQNIELTVPEGFTSINVNGKTYKVEDRKVKIAIAF